VLGDAYQQSGAIDVIVDVSGTTARLPVRTEQALYRVFHESLMNAWRLGHCSAIHATLTFKSDAVTLTIVDDGAGLLAGTRRDGPRMVAAGLRDLMVEVHGTLRIRNSKPTGIVVEATAPMDGPR
jgi:signal transduction histidine kinase